MSLHDPMALSFSSVSLCCLYLLIFSSLLACIATRFGLPPWGGAAMAPAGGSDGISCVGNNQITKYFAVKEMLGLLLEIMSIVLVLEVSRSNQSILEVFCKTKCKNLRLTVCRLTTSVIKDVLHIFDPLLKNTPEGKLRTSRNTKPSSNQFSRSRSGSISATTSALLYRVDCQRTKLSANSQQKKVSFSTCPYHKTSKIDFLTDLIMNNFNPFKLVFVHVCTSGERILKLSSLSIQRTKYFFPTG